MEMRELGQGLDMTQPSFQTNLKVKGIKTILKDNNLVRLNKAYRETCLGDCVVNLIGVITDEL